MHVSAHTRSTNGALGGGGGLGAASGVAPVYGSLLFLLSTCIAFVQLKFARRAAADEKTGGGYVAIHLLSAVFSVAFMAGMASILALGEGAESKAALVLGASTQEPATRYQVPVPVPVARLKTQLKKRSGWLQRREI